MITIFPLPVLIYDWTDIKYVNISMNSAKSMNMQGKIKIINSCI